MAGIVTDIAEAGELVFVTERFAPAAGRLEVAGHWRGVRGRRFVRPVLWLHHGDARRRLVAVLDHKPWAADRRHARLEADLLSLRADRDRVEAELASSRAERPPMRAAPAAAESRLATPRAGAALWLVRAVALGLVTALLAAVALLVAGIL